MSDGFSFSEQVADGSEGRRRELDVAHAAIVTAARRWYLERGNVEAPLAEAMQRLIALERSATASRYAAVIVEGIAVDVVGDEP